MSHRSHRETIDLSSEHAAGEISQMTPKRIKLKVSEKADPSKSMSAEQRFDHDMQTALHMSLQPGQENGITASAGQQFGPANRQYYEERSWALTTKTNTVTHEIILQPEAEDRKRAEVEPAFLRPSEQTGYLSALLTILHAIPLAREAFLYRSMTAEDYGSDPDWWNGSPITLSKIVSMEDGQWKPTGNSGETIWQSSGTDDDSFDHAMHELQRLMAFLDMTKRAYGSTDALTTHDRVRGIGEPNSFITNFLEFWVLSVDENRQNLFATHATKRSQVTGGLQQETCLLLDVDVEHEHGQTLYDVVDRVVWSEQPDQELDEVWFNRAAEVFTIRLRLVGHSDKGVDVKIPAVWYPDRYFQERLDEAREVREAKQKELKKIEKIDDSIERHSKYQSSMNDTLNVKEVLQSTISIIETNFSNRPVNGLSHDHDMEAEPLLSKSEIDRAVQQLKEVSDSISKKLERKRVLTTHMQDKAN
jgi:hypothetical protein